MAKLTLQEELPGISSICDVEYDIEFASGAKPIAEAPYRISPVKWSCCSAEGINYGIRRKMMVVLNGQDRRLNEARSIMGLAGHYHRVG
ncbi:hypothetical protein Tco_0324172 [Tanacetum coccineum]